jgi:hypothetical protein
MIREIVITPVLNGFVCKVGCQSVVFESVATMVQNIEAYYKNPETVEAAFLAKAVNKMSGGPLVGDGQIRSERMTDTPRVCEESVSEVRNPTPLRESVGNARSR